MPDFRNRTRGPRAVKKTRLLMSCNCILIWAIRFGNWPNKRMEPTSTTSGVVCGVIR